MMVTQVGIAALDPDFDQGYKPPSLMNERDFPISSWLHCCERKSNAIQRWGFTVHLPHRKEEAMP
jgi:hypothetical protein